MLNLEQTLRTYDPVMLGVIADRWDVDLETRSVTDILKLLLKTMLNPEAAATTWDRLDDAQRGALQALLGAGGAMPARMFFRLYGEIREMGPGRLEREKPYLEPASITEALFYRGLIARGYEEAAAGPQAVIYIPTDLARVLPAHRTGFDLSTEDAEDELPADEDEEDALAASQPEEIIPADTALVDDLATLLAYLQVAAVSPREDGALPEAHIDTLNTFLLKREAGRLDFLLGLARTMGLVGPRDGLLKPISVNARRWLEAPRSEQVRLLAVAWRETVDYNDLNHTPGLIVESAGNDPRLARAVIAEVLAALPADAWWIVDGVVEEIRANRMDFQRPGGDYDSWYIRAAADGSYLGGFDHWDAVEGAMLRFILTGPLHWLGLADRGQHAGRALGRLNAYGRAFVSGGKWPALPDPEVAPVLHDDGTLEVSRRLSRYDRFQIARFTEWLSAGEPYRYRLSAAGLRRAAIQEIEPRHVRAFLSRALGSDSLPASVDALLTRWAQSAEADVTIETLTVMRTTSPQALDTILEEPSLRRYLGARLGPEAVVVRPGQAVALQNALAAFGLLAEVIGPKGDEKA